MYTLDEFVTQAANSDFQRTNMFSVVLPQRHRVKLRPY